MGENMNYPDSPIDFIKQYSFSDKQRVYTNGSELISVFRVGQMIEHYMSDFTPQQIKDMQFCLREKSRECAELRKRTRELEEGGKDKDGWIPVEKFGLPHSNEHDFRFWVTIQYTNGFRATIKAKWDCFDKCFIHQNGKKILQDVIAYKYYSAPEPYRPERSDNNDGE